jgi:anti-anti-sigma factor
MGSGRTLKVQRTEHEGCLRLMLVGELDLATGPRLEEHLRRLAEDKVTVRLDLSRLDFIDSTGLHLLIRAIQDSRRDGWALEVEPEVSQPVRRLLRIANVEDFVLGRESP